VCVWHDVGGVLVQHLELLHYACEYGHMELIAFLIHQGVDIFVPDADGSVLPSLALSLALPFPLYDRDPIGILATCCVYPGCTVQVRASQHVTYACISTCISAHGSKGADSNTEKGMKEVRK
jgi:hypothetical protein